MRRKYGYRRNENEKSYLIKDFQKTVSRQFSAKSTELNTAFFERLAVLRSENRDASKEKQRHPEKQILPGIAIYETLQAVISKDKTPQAVHCYTEQHAHKMKKVFLTLMHIPGLYRKVPGIFGKQTPKLFVVTAGFAAHEIQITGKVWRIDMIQCPYHYTCVKYSCPELCRCFCDSDDISYYGLHPKLLWHRTKTPVRGDEVCDFCIKITK